MSVTRALRDLGLEAAPRGCRPSQGDPLRSGRGNARLRPSAREEFLVFSLRTDAMTMRRLLPVVAPQREVNGAKTARHSAGAQGRPSCHRTTNHVTRNRSAKSQVVVGGISVPTAEAGPRLQSQSVAAKAVAEGAPTETARVGSLWLAKLTLA